MGNKFDPRVQSAYGLGVGEPCSGANAKRFRPPRWFYDPPRAALVRTKEGMYEEGLEAQIDTVIHFNEIPSLVQALEENRLLKPRLDDRLRAEDLKITHRLLDIIETVVKTR